MATYFFGINDGKELATVTQSATTTSKDIELVINTTANVGSKQELINAMQNLLDAVIQSPKNW